MVCGSWSVGIWARRGDPVAYRLVIFLLLLLREKSRDTRVSLMYNRSIICRAADLLYRKANTHCRLRRDSTVELSRVVGVNTPVGSRDPVTISCAVELLRLVISDDTMTSLSKKLSISIKIHVIIPL